VSGKIYQTEALAKANRFWRLAENDLKSLVSEASDVYGIDKAWRVIPPFLAGCIRRIHAAIFSFMAGVMPPMAMFGRSLL